MSKIIINIGALSYGGAERVVSILSSNFCDAFDEVEIIMWHKINPYYKIDKRVKLTYLSDISGTENRLKNVKTFRKYIKSDAADIIISFLTPFNMLALLSLLGVKKKIIVCERNDPHYVPGGIFVEIIRNLLYLDATGVLVQTYYGLSCFPKVLQKKMSVIYNPVIMPAHLLGAAVSHQKDNKFVAVGRLDPQKNHKMLIDAFCLFHEKHEDYKLYIYGEGNLREELEQYVASKGLENSIVMPGEEHNVWEKMLSAKGFLLSSDAEGMSNALIEAMCLGLPVVSTKVSGSTDLVIPEINGYLIDVGDSVALFNSMENIVSDDDKAYQLGKKASELYSHLNYSKISKEWVDYLTNSIESD